MQFTQMYAHRILILYSSPVATKALVVNVSLRTPSQENRYPINPFMINSSKYAAMSSVLLLGFVPCTNRIVAFCCVVLTDSVKSTMLDCIRSFMSISINEFPASDGKWMTRSEKKSIFYNITIILCVKAQT